MLRTAEQLLQDSPSLGKLIKEANRLRKLGVVFRSCIDHEFEDHCVLARADDDQIVVIIDNAT